MALIRNAANRKLKGRIGDTTYYVSLDRQVARQALNNSNYGDTARRSEAQQNRRVRWANLVNFYKVSKSWMKKAFESKATNQTDYNRFMSANLPGARIALTKNMASVSSAIADAFIISQGSLRTIGITKHTTHWDTDIALGTLAISDLTTLAEFSQAVVANNTWIQYGDQISFVSYQQYMDAQSYPHLICTAYEVTLEKEGQGMLRDYLPEFAASSDSDGFLGTGSDISLGAFAYVLSRNVNGGSLLVSTQQLVLNNDALIRQYSSVAAFNKAVESYGVDQDTFLDTGSRMIAAEGQPVYISYYEAATYTVYPNGSSLIPFRNMTTAGLKIKLSAVTAMEVVSVEILPATNTGQVRDSSLTFSTGIVHATGSDIVAVGGSNMAQFYESDVIASITITFEDGSTATALFDVTPEERGD